MTNQPLADVVGLCVFLAALLFSAEVAAVVGPFLVIAVASAVGASFSLARRDRSSRKSALLFFLRVVALAILATGLISTIVTSFRPDLHERLLLAPVALFVGFVGDDWPKVFGRLLEWVYAALDLMRGGKGGAP